MWWSKKTPDPRLQQLEQRLRTLEAVNSALDRSTAIIHFDLDARVTAANDNFVKAMGYTSERDIVGQPHARFCPPTYAASAPTAARSGWKPATTRSWTTPGASSASSSSPATSPGRCARSCTTRRCWPPWTAPWR